MVPNMLETNFKKGQKGQKGSKRVKKGSKGAKGSNPYGTFLVLEKHCKKYCVNLYAYVFSEKALKLRILR